MIRLRTVLTIPFALQLMGATIITGGIFWYFSRQAIVHLIGESQGQTSVQLNKNLHDYLQSCTQVNELNAGNVERGLIDISNSQAVKSSFLNQIFAFQVDSIFYGNAQGGFTSVGRRSDGTLLVSETEKFSNSGQFSTYEVNRKDDRIRLLKQSSHYDPRQRSWYQAAAAKRSTVWIPAFQTYSNGHFEVAVSQPIYDQQNQLVGVTACGLGLSHISRYLSKLSEISDQQNQVFVVDSAGLLLASSSDQDLYATNQNTHLVDAGQSQSNLIRQTDAQLRQRYGRYDRIQSANLVLDGDRSGRYFVQITPIVEPGLNWWVIDVVAESKYMHSANMTKYLTIANSILILSLLLITSIIIVRCINRPILALEDASRLIAQGEGNEIEFKSDIYELDTLIRSFNQMSAQVSLATDRLQQSNQQLQASNRHLQARVAEQTAKVLQALDYGRVLVRISQRLSTMSDQQQIFHFAMEQLANLLQVTYCNLVVYHLASNRDGVMPEEYLEALQASYQSPSIGVDSSLVLPFSEFQEVYFQLLQGQPIQFCAIVSRPFAGQPTQATLLLCPMIDDGGLQGDLLLVKFAEDVFEIDEVQLVQQVANQCAIALRQVRLQR